MASESVHYMVCTCGDGGKLDALNMRKRVRNALGLSDDSKLLTAIVVSLNWDFNAYIYHIVNDMWSGVQTRSHSEDGLEVFIECDEVEDGIVYAWYEYARRAWGEDLERKTDK